MKKVIVIAFVVMFAFAATVSAQQQPPTVQSSVKGVLRAEEDGRWATFAFNLEQGRDAKITICVEMYGFVQGGHCTEEREFRGDGQIQFQSIPTIPQYYGQLVTA